MGARAVRAGALYPAGDVTIIQTMLCEPSQVHSNPGQIATGSPAVFINPNPCPPRSKKWLAHGVPTARVASRKRTLFATGTTLSSSAWSSQRGGWSGRALVSGESRAVAAGVGLGAGNLD